MQRYKEHIEEIKDRSKQWAKENPDKRKKISKRWNKNNPEKSKAISKRWAMENKERKKETNRLWRESNPERVKEIRIIAENKRRSLKEKNGGSFTIEEWDCLKKKCNYTCLMCEKKEPEIKLTIDHIIPISKGGNNWIENIQPLCRSCNTRKGVKIIRLTGDYQTPMAGYEA